MAHRFSKQLLYDIRNRIPIRYLIERKLNISCRMEGNLFRFECPVCNFFHTSVKYSTNLARCFECERNFNTIDMVMVVRNRKFFDSAVFLEEVLKTLKIEKRQKTIFSQCENLKTDFKARRGRSEPVVIADILDKNHMLTNGNTNSEKLCVIQCRRTKNRIEALENEIKFLNRRLEQLHKFIAGVFVGRTNFRRSSR